MMSADGLQRDPCPDGERRLLEPLAGLRAQSVGAGDALAVGDQRQVPGLRRVLAHVGGGAGHGGQLDGRAQLALGFADRGGLGVGEDHPRAPPCSRRGAPRRGCWPRRRGPGTCRRRSAARCRSSRRWPTVARRRSCGCPPAPRRARPVSTPRPSVRGRRPVATTSRSPRSSSRPELEHVVRRRRGAPRRRAGRSGARCPRRAAPGRGASPSGWRLSLGEHPVRALDDRDLLGAQARAAPGPSPPRPGPAPSTSIRRGTSVRPVTSRLVQMPVELPQARRSAG